MAATFDLSGKKGLVIAIADDQSIAYGCAVAFKRSGADIAITYADAKSEPYVRPLAETLHASMILPCDVRVNGQLESVFEQIKHRWGKLDFLLHAVGGAKEEMQGRLVDCSLSGFQSAMDITCHSFIRMAKHAEPLMTAGGSMTTVSFLGAERVVEGFGVTGPSKAALECAVKYLAIELGGAGIRVNAISPTAVATRTTAASKEFDQRLPGRAPVAIGDVGDVAAFLASDASKRIAGEVFHVDCGYHVLA